MDEEPPERRRERTLGEALAGIRVSTAVAVVGLLVIVVGSFGPWVTVLLASVSGIHGDGKITAVLAGAGVVALLAANGGTVGRILAGVAAVAAGAVAGYDSIDAARVLSHATIFGQQIASVSWGLYAILVGAVITVVALAASAREILRGAISALAVACGLGVIIAAALQKQQVQPASANTPTVSTPATTAATTTSSAAATSAATTSSASTTSSAAATSSAASTSAAVTTATTPTPAILTACDQNISASPKSLCSDLADWIFIDVAIGEYDGTGVPSQAYSYACSLGSGTVTCATGAGSNQGIVSFPLRAAQVYYGPAKAPTQPPTLTARLASRSEIAALSASASASRLAGFDGAAEHLTMVALTNNGWAMATPTANNPGQQGNGQIFFLMADGAWHVAAVGSDVQGTGVPASVLLVLERRFSAP